MTNPPEGLLLQLEEGERVLWHASQTHYPLTNRRALKQISPS